MRRVEHGHQWGQVDDCTRCINCEALIGTGGHCWIEESPDNPEDLPSELNRWVPFGFNAGVPFGLTEGLVMQFTGQDESEDGLPTLERWVQP